MKIYRNQKYNFKGIILIATIGILLAIFSIIIYLNLEFLITLFAPSNPIPQSDNSGGKEVPYISADNTSSTEAFYAKPEALSDMIHSVDSYTREFRVISTYDDRETTLRYTLIQSGGNCKVESDSQTIIYNAGELYIHNRIYSNRVSGILSDAYKEVGITTLEDLLLMAETQETDYSLSTNGKVLTVNISDASRATRSTYELALETGIILSEVHYYNEKVFLKVLTDSVTVHLTDDISDEIFVIPE